MSAKSDRYLVPQLFFHPQRSVINIVIVLGICMVTFAPAVWGQKGATKEFKPTPPATWSWLPDQVRDRLAIAQKTPWRERADEVLIPRAQVRWPRYLSSLLRFPVWVELGASFRLRYEALTNPFRKGEFGTAEQVATRTRARMGLTGEIFRFLFEFQDSRMHDVDTGEF